MNLYKVWVRDLSKVLWWQGVIRAASAWDAIKQAEMLVRSGSHLAPGAPLDIQAEEFQFSWADAADEPAFVEAAP